MDTVQIADKLSEALSPPAHNTKGKRLAIIVLLALVAELITGLVRWALHGRVPQLTNDYLFFCLTISAYPLLVGFFTRRAGASLVGASLLGAAVFLASTTTSAAAWLNNYGSLIEFPRQMLSASADMLPTQAAFGLLGSWLAGFRKETPNPTIERDAPQAGRPSL